MTTVAVTGVSGFIGDAVARRYAEHAAGTGALMALLNRDHRREIEETVTRIEKIETALEPHFQQLFIDAMALPNKVDPFPKLAAAVKLPARKADGEDGVAGDATPRRYNGSGTTKNNHQKQTFRIRPKIGRSQQTPSSDRFAPMYGH